MKTIALSYDDGPDAWTEPILDLLHEHLARAAFFVLGANVFDHEHLLQRMRDDGHDIGNHGWSHTHMGNLSDEQAVDEIETTQWRVQAAGVPLPTLWRAPYLSARPETIRLAAARLGVAHVGITVDPRDYASSTDQIVEAVRNAPDRAIVGLHDGVPPDGGNSHNHRRHTVEATERILQLPGLRFATVSELWASTQAA